MRIIYYGAGGKAATSTHRRWAIERLGHEVIEFDAGAYASGGGWLRNRLRVRTLIGETINRLNRDLIDLAERRRPDIIWFDKATFVQARTIRALRAGGFYTAHYNPDNPFGRRNDPGWRLFVAALPEYDLHLVPRESNLEQYRRAGARDVRLMPFAYEPTLHFPPPDGWSDADRLYDAVFIGAPYDQRAQFLADLWQRHGIPVRIWGDARLWRRALPTAVEPVLFQGGLLWNKDYRETIWRSRICLSFVTHSNADDVARRSFEITASGGFMLVEDTPGHRAMFRGGEEAVFFSSLDDCARQIARYLPDEAARARIAKAGLAHTTSSGWSNDARMESVLGYINEQRARRARKPMVVVPEAIPLPWKAPTSARRRRILYVGALGPTATSTHRRQAIERLGHDVIEFDTEPYVAAGGRLFSGLRLRALVGETIERMNRELLALATREKPDIIWFDKAVFVRRETVSTLRATDSFAVHYTLDNPFGLRHDPGWRLFVAALPEYDLHLVPRENNLAEYRRAGARDVRLMPLAYEPTVHFPPPDGWSDADRLYEVVFIGAPYDQRAQFFSELWQRHGIPVRIWGDARLWRRALPAAVEPMLFQGGLLWNKDYRETIWRSRICLSFVTHANNDSVAHRSFEITASGGFMLVEDTPGHRAMFRDGEEAVFFSSLDDCARQIARYLPDEAARARIAKAGLAHTTSSGWSNDARLADAIAYIETLLPSTQGQTAAVASD